MFSPGGFDSTLENWRDGRHLPAAAAAGPAARERYTCITFDRRESGPVRRPGRAARRGPDYVAQGVGLLDHLGIERAHLMGGCVGCSTVAALAVAHPERALGMVLYSPAGGAKYRMKQHARFVDAPRLRPRSTACSAVVELARRDRGGFTNDPRVGPWAAVLRRDAEFAARYAATDPGRYRTAGHRRRRGCCSTATPCREPEPEDLLAPRRARADRARAGRLARPVGRPLPPGVPAAGPSTGTCRWPSRPRRPRRSGCWTFLDGRHGHRSGPRDGRS